MIKMIRQRHSVALASALAFLVAAAAIASCGGHTDTVATPGSSMSRAHGVRPSATEPPPSPSAYLDDTWNGIHALQPFDNFDNKYILSPQQAMQDGPLYNAVWGSNSGKMVSAWKTNNRTIRTSDYLPIGLDALNNQFGNRGHLLGWWNKNHPDWVLYECDQVTVAFVGGLPEVPLDISNQNVISYLENNVGTYAENHGYAALGVDFAELNNPTGGGHGGTRGCGVWTQNHTVWVQKFSGQQIDPKYAAAVLNWLSSFHSYLHGLPRPLALWGNNVPGNATYGDSGESQIISNVDLVEDESGDARYGHFADDIYFNNRVKWAQLMQSEGKGYFETALFPVQQLTNAQLEYSIASYLMSKEQASSMDAFPYGFYGQEHYYQPYKADIGTPCAELYGGKPYNGQLVYYRKYSNGLAIISTSGSLTYTVNLPQSQYTDAVTGQTVNSPLQVPPFSGFVLLASNGCS